MEKKLKKEILINLNYLTLNGFIVVFVILLLFAISNGGLSFTVALKKKRKLIKSRESFGEQNF